MAIFLIGLLTLGAVGLFLAMPGGRADAARLGFLLLAAAGGAFIAVIELAATRGTSLGGFLGCALIALFAAFRVITHTRPVYSALYFVLLVVAVTALLVLMQAEFLAVALVIVYAGAILVTYVFVIMFAHQGRPVPYDAKSREPLLGCLAGFALLTVIAAQSEMLKAAADRTPLPAAVRDAAGTVEAIGVPLLTDYVIGIQMAGLLLLAAMVGAIAIARRPSASDAASEGEERC